MSQFKPLKYRDVITILKNLGFQPEPQGPTSHQTWMLKRENKNYAVTVMSHGNIEFKRGTLQSMIRQSGFTKEEFYKALYKK